MMVCDLCGSIDEDVENVVVIVDSQECDDEEEFDVCPDCLNQITPVTLFQALKKTYDKD